MVFVVFNSPMRNTRVYEYESVVEAVFDCAVSGGTVIRWIETSGKWMYFEIEAMKINHVQETTMVTDVEIWDLLKLMLNIGAMCLFIDLARKFAGKK